MVDLESNDDKASAWNKTNRGNQKYDAWLHWTVTTKCNLSCSFCIASTKQQGIINSKKLIIEKLLKTVEMGGVSALFATLRYGVERIIFRTKEEKINIPLLIKTLDRTNRVFRIGFTGGEPFLIPNFIEACEEITNKHYIAINTNLTSAKIKDFCLRIDPLRVVHFHASAHIEELQKHHLLDRYISTYLICKEKGFNIFSRMVAYPPYLPEVEKHKRYFKEKGIDLIFGPFFGWHQGKQYPQAYTEEEIEIFGLNKTSDSDIKHFYQKGKMCNAGYNAGVVDPSGIIRPCFLIHRTIGNIYKYIRFTDKLIKCPFDLCHCPLKGFDHYLFDKALKECGVIEKQ